MIDFEGCDVMKFKMFLSWTLMFLVLINFANAEYCFQEQANVSTTCGGLNTGSYNESAPTNGYWRDGSYDDLNTTLSSGLYLYVNYTLPYSAIGGYVQEKHYAYLVTETKNWSSYYCWNSSSINDVLQLRYSQQVHSGYYYIDIHCMRNNEWFLFRSIGGSAVLPDMAYNRIYEESMWWDIGAAGLNISVFDSNTHTEIYNWTITISNSTTTYSNILQTNPSFYNWSIIPRGPVTITISDGLSTIYYQNYTNTSTYIDNNKYIPLSVYLVEKTNNNATITSSNGLSFLQGVSNTISCSALSGPTSLYINSVNVSQPYTFKPTAGIYTVMCESYETDIYAPDTETQTITVTNSGYGCTDNTTYAFSTPISPTGTYLTLNFTGLAENNIVKSDLSDVYVTAPATINITDGFFVTVNTTGISNFTAYFGNYFAYNIYEYGVLSENISNIDANSQNNPYYVLSFIDEMSGEENLPQNSNASLISIYCNHGVSTTSLNDSHILVSSFERLDEIKTTISYSSSEIYSRNIHIDDDVEYRYVYLPDATQYQVVQLLMDIVDTTGLFSSGDLIVRKNINGNQEIITENTFDVESKVIVYLINGEKYMIYVDSGDDIRSIGYLYVDTVDLTKTIYIGDVYTTNSSYQNISYSLELINNDTISLSYIDNAGVTSSVEFYVYNYTDGALLYSASTTNHSIINFNYVVPDTDGQYQANVKIHHPLFGENTISITQLFQLGEILPEIFLSDEWMLRIVVFFLSLVPLYFGAKHGGTGAIVFVVCAMVFAFFEWFEISMAVLIIALVLAIFSKMTEERRVE